MCTVPETRLVEQLPPFLQKTNGSQGRRRHLNKTSFHQLVALQIGLAA
tara:strand:- start:4298 stop:4441 length:144 start_codon:yes stop_codon:yes gene_type:complete